MEDGQIGENGHHAMSHVGWVTRRGCDAVTTLHLSMEELCARETGLMSGLASLMSNAVVSDLHLGNTHAPFAFIFALLPVDGAWCDWGEWTTCLSSGFQTAFRACECPRPQFGGEKCKGMSQILLCVFQCTGRSMISCRARH